MEKGMVLFEVRQVAKDVRHSALSKNTKSVVLAYLWEVKRRIEELGLHG